MADKEWRPENWPEIKREVCNSRQEPTYACADCDRGCTTRDSMLIEDTASAMHKADIEHLDTPCWDHPAEINTSAETIYVEYNGTHYAHKKDCPICYAAWAQGEKI